MSGQVVGRVPFGEGPVWCDDDTLIICSTAMGSLYRVWPDGAREEVFADLGGGANGAAPAIDGGFLVCQNGGVDLAEFGITNGPTCRPVAPGLQHVTADGQVRYVVQGGVQAPNDLVTAPDGTVYFTDPPRVRARIADGKMEMIFPDEPIGRVWKLDHGGELSLFADSLIFPNGIALDGDGHVVIIEERGLMRLLPDGTREWIIEALGPGGGDGFCLDVEGNFYVAATTDACVRVVDPSGKLIDELPTPHSEIHQHASNCCFGGPDMRTLYCSEMPGRVSRWENMPIAGRPLTKWTPIG